MGAGKTFVYVIIPIIAFIVACGRFGDSEPAQHITAADKGVRAEPASDVGGPRMTGSSSSSARPNVLIISIDTLRADHLGAYGSSRVKTPNIDALASRGARFDMAISQFSQTNPSHASLLTGTYPATHKLKIHGSDKISPSVTTLAQVLGNQGYSTAGIYSWPSFDPEMSGLDRGFATYKGIYFDVPEFRDSTDFWRKRNGRADLTTDAVLGWLRGNTATPFFLWVHYQDPHYPYVPPPPFDTMYDPGCAGCPDGNWPTIDRLFAGEHLSDEDLGHVVAKYDEVISFTDHEIGRVFDGLRDLDVLDKTMIIVTADHGESFLENGRWAHPFILYNTVVRVPLIVSYPPVIPEGGAVGAVAQLVDVAPTILDLIGASIPRGVEGRSLMPLLLGSEKGDDRMAITQIPDDSSISMVVAGWKLIRNNTNGELEMYDLNADPKELVDLARSNRGRALDLEKKLIAWMDSRGIKHY